MIELQCPSEMIQWLDEVEAFRNFHPDNTYIHYKLLLLIFMKKINLLFNHFMQVPLAI